MKNISWDELTPAYYVIADVNDIDLDVGGSMAQSSVRHSEVVDINAEDLPMAFRPDWNALGADADLTKKDDAFNVWVRKHQANIKAPAALWNAKDYQGAVELTENAANPGPINGEKPEDYE